MSMTTHIETTFICHDCRQERPVTFDGGTGYGLDESGNQVCYECCGVRDRQYMETHDRILLYLVKRPDAPLRTERMGSKVWEYLHPADWEVTNWPGTLRFPVVDITKGRHNLAGVRYNVYFNDHLGRPWYGVQYGDMTQVVHCRRVKVGRYR